ncbi:hypothetical protein K437DRAFT_109695 [Tilletiaria anomala UBC 951]|uniref:N-acetyltransferase domain-containing protein n=1 Tax=Tilletiaria anomala (strain ATCC 24038 / CBS 436.72 / UBC 951) TaxID=1037660 RepID=A0A066W6C3_TILAU|nr:uncharacterized protein K437DRAFT_109695 [Tilletiaria anomala UBC 951]KDN46310.1 hypothetical protein K437DRAFT_109695 [Tilletiaria anomala UBC 951]
MEAPKKQIKVVLAEPQDADTLGDIHGRAFASCLTSIFPMGPELTVPYLDFRRSQCRRQAVAVHDPVQKSLRKSYPSILLKAVLRDQATGKDEIVGVLVGQVVPRRSDSVAKASIDRADASLPVLKFPEGYNERIWNALRDLMIKAEADFVGNQTVLGQFKISSLDIGILAVSSAARGYGIGRAMIDHLKSHYPGLPICLTAFESAVGFYGRNGFECPRDRMISHPDWGFRLFPCIWRPTSTDAVDEENIDNM